MLNLKFIRIRFRMHRQKDRKVIIFVVFILVYSFLISVQEPNSQKDNPFERYIFQSRAVQKLMNQKS